MVSSPKPPDPYKTADAQGAANREAAEASAIIGNVNERNPYGSISYNKIGEEMVNGKPVSRYERYTQLSPEQQRLLELQTGTQTNLGELGVSQSERLQGLLGKSLDTEGLSPWQSYTQPGQLPTTIGDTGQIRSSYGGNNPITMGVDFSKIGNYGDVRQDQGATDRQALEDAMLARYRSQSGKDREAQDAALAARGLNPGSSQYSDVMGERNKQDVDAYQQAYLASGSESRAAQDAYNQAQNQRFGQGLTSQQQEYTQAIGKAGFENTAQQQAYQQELERAGFANAAQGQEYEQAMGRAGFDAASQQQNIQNMQNYVNMMNALRGQQLGERQTIRNAPINEISALMGGSQVSVPQGQGYNAPSVGSVPIADYINQNYNARASNAAATNQGLFGLGGAFLGMF